MVKEEKRHQDNMDFIKKSFYKHSHLLFDEEGKYINKPELFKGRSFSLGKIKKLTQ